MDAVAEAKALATWHDVKIFRDSDDPASKLSEFVNRHFPALTEKPDETDLKITNSLG